MKVAAVLGLATLGALAAAARRVHAVVTPERVRRYRPARLSPEIRSLIEREAVAQGLAPEVALVFAELESGFDPNAYGDRDWAYRHPREWQATQQRMSANPAIHDPSVWGSYGLFGLLAAYHVAPLEHPHALWNTALNAQRGVAAVKHALESAHGDLRGARLIYVGCGVDGRRCSPKYLKQTEARLRAAAQNWLPTWRDPHSATAPTTEQQSTVRTARSHASV